MASTIRTFSGVIRLTPLSNPNLDPQYNATLPLPFLSTPVLWNPGQEVPTAFRGPLSSFANDPAYRTSYNFTLALSARMGADAAVVGAFPYVEGNIYTGIPPVVYRGFSKRAGPSDFIEATGLLGSTWNYNLNINETYPIPTPPTQMNVSFFDYCPFASANICPGQHSIQNALITTTLNVTVTVNCTESNLENPACFDYCTQTKGCLSEYLDYCFTAPTGATGARIGQTTGTGQTTRSSQVCTDYFQRRITDPSLGFDAPTAQALNTYCVTKYRNLQNLLQSNDTLGIQLCACNMNQQDYDERYATLTRNIPNVDILQLNRRCIVGQCNGGGWKNSSTGKQCAPIPCLNLALIENNGSISDSRVVVTQTGQCANLDVRTSPTGPAGPISPTGPVSPTGPGRPITPPQPTPAPAATNITNIIFWVVAAIVILILLILLIVMITRR